MDTLTKPQRSVARAVLERVCSGDVLWDAYLFKKGDEVHVIDKAPEHEPERVNTPLQANTAWPAFKARRVTLQVPYKGPEATIALPGAWDVCVKLL